MKQSSESTFAGSVHRFSMLKWEAPWQACRTVYQLAPQAHSNISMPLNLVQVLDLILEPDACSPRPQSRTNSIFNLLAPLSRTAAP